MPSPSHEALLDVVEASYRFDVDTPAWLRGIAAAAAPVLDEGLGVATYLFDARDPERLQMLDACFPPAVDLEMMRGYLSSVPADFVERTWLKAPCTYASQFDGFEALAPGLASFGGARDVIAMAGRDPTGLGVWLGAMLPKVARPSAKRQAILSRLAAHLATSYRLRRALAGAVPSADDADAVVAPDGKIAHAEGDAETSAARVALGKAAIALDRARSKAGRAEPEKAISWWQAMVEARWTLVDHFDHDGKRFLLAQRNDAAVDGLAQLTEREAQVVAYAMLGHDNKVIAYELGIAPSTVRVLVHRAATKMGVDGREALLAKVRRKPSP